LPTIAGIGFDRPNLAGGSGNITNASITLSQPAPLQGASLTLYLSPNAPASFSATSSLTQIIVNIPSGGTQVSVPIYTEPVSQQTDITLTADYLGDSAVGQVVLEAWLSGLQISPGSVIGGQSVTGTVLIEEPAPAGGLTVNLAVDQPALVTIPSTVTVAAGQVTGNFPISTNGVAANTNATVTAGYGGASETQGLLIEPASISTFTFNPTPVDGGTATTGTVTLNGLPGSSFKVNLTGLPAGFTATPASLSFSPGANGSGNSQKFTLTTPQVNKTSTVTVTATRADNGQTANATVTVFAQPPSGISVTGPNPINSGTTSKVTVTLNSPADAGGTIVHVDSQNAAASLVLADGTLAQTEVVVIPAGNTTIDVPVQAGVVTADTNVNFDAHRGGVEVVTPKPLVVKGLVANIVLGQSSLYAAQFTTAIVTLSGAAPKGGVIVPLTVTDAASGNASNAVLLTPKSVTIPAGSTSGRTTVTASSLITMPNFVNINVTLSGVTNSAPLAVYPIGVTRLLFSPSTVVGGNSTTLTVSIDAPAPTGGLVIHLASTNPTLAAIPATVTIAAGQTVSSPVKITTNPVSRTLSTAVGASLNGSSASGTLTVTASPL
jgi:plastocyanin